MDFEFYDRSQDVRITEGDLPHWFQPGVTYFITFRTADSVPVEVLRQWHRHRNDWLQRHGIDAAPVVRTLRVRKLGPQSVRAAEEPSADSRTRSVRTTADSRTRSVRTTADSRTRSVRTTADSRTRSVRTTAQLQSLSAAEQREYHRLFSREFMEYLDRGYGECLLRRSDLAEIVADSLRHGDGTDYQMADFVVMPNHVHLLACLLGENDLVKLCYSWKKYTATRINQVLGRRGRFWQDESFDHLVRSAEQFDGFRLYIADNPTKAGLRKGEYLLWKRSM
jgi:putative transposase